MRRRQLDVAVWENIQHQEKAPNSNLQAPEKLQAPSSNVFQSQRDCDSKPRVARNEATLGHRATKDSQPQTGLWHFASPRDIKHRRNRVAVEGNLLDDHPG